MQLILPEFFFVGRIEEREVTDVVDENVAENGELGVRGGDFAEG